VGEVSQSVVVQASLAETWDFYFRPDAWPAWVDGFARVEEADGYPEAGGGLRWISVPAGRGEVRERVLEHEPRRVHRIAFSDPESEGELETRFEIEPGERTATRVTQRLTYKIGGGGPLGPIVDRLFVRSQLRRSLARSLGRLQLELEERASARPPS
jgi:hypothetical protein